MDGKRLSQSLTAGIPSPKLRCKAPGVQVRLTGLAEITRGHYKYGIQLRMHSAKQQTLSLPRFINVLHCSVMSLGDATLQIIPTGQPIRNAGVALSRDPGRSPVSPRLPSFCKTSILDSTSACS